MSPDALSVAVRACAFAALFQAAGVVLFVALYGTRLGALRERLQRLGVWAAACGGLLLCVHQLLQGARLAGGWSGCVDAQLQRLALLSGAGLSHSMQVAALLLIALGLRRTGRRALTSRVAGVALAVAAFAFTGHTSVHPLRWILAPLLMLHVGVVAFWFGALVPLLIVLRDASLQDATWIFARFSALASWLVPLIAVAGIAMALILAPDWSVATQPWGELLWVKLAAFALLLVLAAANKWRLVPGLVRAVAGAPESGGSAPPSAAALRRSIALEYVLILAVLAVTATLTTFYSPEG